MMKSDSESLHEYDVMDLLLQPRPMSPTEQSLYDAIQRKLRRGDYDQQLEQPKPIPEDEQNLTRLPPSEHHTTSFG
jgi:hypothetical protein